MFSALLTEPCFAKSITWSPSWIIVSPLAAMTLSFLRIAPIEIPFGNFDFLRGWPTKEDSEIASASSTSPLPSTIEWTSKILPLLFVIALLFLALSFALEIIGQIPDLAVVIFGDVFILARISHAYTLIGGGNIIFRQMGILLSWLVILAQAIWAMFISGNWLISNNFGLNI